MKEIIIPVVAIACLTILGVITKVESVTYTVAVIISGVLGHFGPKAYTYLKNLKKYE